MLLDVPVEVPHTIVVVEPQVDWSAEYTEPPEPRVTFAITRLRAASVNE